MLSATLGQAQFLTHSHLHSAIQASSAPGATVTLPADNFYIRRRVNCTAGASGYPAGMNLRVVGASQNGRPKTRIIGGIPVPEIRDLL